MHLAGGTHEVAYLTVPQGEFDCWRNTYKCRRNIICSDGSVMPVGTYSLGEDGTSRSQGNDPDDISSWNPDRASFYLARLNRQILTQFATMALVLAFPIYGAIKLAELALMRLMAVSTE